VKEKHFNEEHLNKNHDHKLTATLHEWAQKAARGGIRVRPENAPNRLKK